MMSFVNICGVFYTLWFLSNSFLNLMIVSLYTFIVVSSYLMLVVYINVPVCTLCGRGKNIDEKYNQCIVYFLRRPCHLQGSKSSWLM